MSEVTPNYPVIELEAKTELLKDKLILMLEEKVKRLEEELNVYKAQGLVIKAPVEFELPVEGLITTRPRLRTMSEVGRELEKRSLNAISLKEEPKNA